MRYRTTEAYQNRAGENDKMRTFIVLNGADKYGPYFVIRERKPGPYGTYVWEWVSSCSTREAAEGIARGLGNLTTGE